MQEVGAGNQSAFSWLSEQTPYYETIWSQLLLALEMYSLQNNNYENENHMQENPNLIAVCTLYKVAKMSWVLLVNYCM